MRLFILLVAMMGGSDSGSSKDFGLRRISLYSQGEKPSIEG